jgi:hypothetical protein
MLRVREEAEGASRKRGQELLWFPQETVGKADKKRKRGWFQSYQWAVE